MGTARCIWRASTEESHVYLLSASTDSSPPPSDGECWWADWGLPPPRFSFWAEMRASLFRLICFRCLCVWGDAEPGEAPSPSSSISPARQPAGMAKTFLTFLPCRSRETGAANTFLGMWKGFFYCAFHTYPSHSRLVHNFPPN